MKIISLKMLYECDHSSTNYLFFTAEDKVPEKIKSFLREKNSRGKIRNNIISFHIPGEDYLEDEIEEKLLADYNIPIMIYEDYDWWNINMVFDFEEPLLESLVPYKDVGKDHRIFIKRLGEKIVVTIVIHLKYDKVVEMFEKDIFEGLQKIFSEVRNNVNRGDLSDLELLRKYCEEKPYFQSAKTKIQESLVNILGSI